MMSKISYEICCFREEKSNLDIVVCIDIRSVQTNEEIGYMNCIDH